MGFYGNEDYPKIYRLSDPLLIRIDEYSLQVGETTFFAKVKFGQAFKGYLVYASGLNVPIYTYDVTKGFTYSQDSVVQSLTNVNLSSSVKIEQIEKQAKEWVDVLQEEILSAPEGDSLKSAIDRFNWQIHRDITGSDFDMRNLEGFSNVTIDGVDDAITVHGVVTNTSTATQMAINTIANNIKEPGDKYTISKALREDSQNSVSGSVKEQTELERTEFNDIEGRIGSPRTTGENPESLWSTLTNINGNSAHQDETIHTIVSTIKDSVGEKTGAETIYKYTSRIGTNNDSTGTSLFGKVNEIGNIIGHHSSIGTNTIMGTLDKIHMSMYGSSDSGGSYYGFVEGPNQVGDDRTIIVKSRTV